MGPGRFITFEGVDGSGKSTQARLLATHLRDLGRDVVLTREPGGAPGAELLRNVILENAVGWSPLAQTFLFFAARAEHVEKTIRPALARGAWVICDRFTDSTIAYQGGGEALGRAAIDHLIQMIGLMPDATLILDVSDEVRAARIKKRAGDSDYFERQPDSYFNAIRKAFREIAAADPARCRLIQGGQCEQQTLKLVLQALETQISQRID